MAALGQIAELEMGQSPPGDTYNDEGVGLPLLNGPTEFGPRSPTPVTWTTTPTRRAKPGDILFCVRGSTTGRMNRADQEYCIGRGIAALRGETKADTDFIDAAIRAGLDRLLMMTTGSTFPNLSRKDLQEFAIPWPDSEMRAAVAAIIRALDDKIESNRRIAKTLEEIAATQFKARFVDFVGYDDLVESALGPIPCRWNVRPLDDVAAVLRRGRAPMYVDEGGILVVNQKCVRDGRVSFQLARRHDEQRRSSEDRRLRLGDVLINSTGVGTLGRVSQVRWLPEPATVDGHVTMVRADVAEINQDYLAMNMMQREHDLERMGHGSTGQTELTRSRLAEFPIIVPPPRQQTSFSEFYSPICEQIGALESQAITLSRIRDSLLPKLISGNLRMDLSDFEGNPP